MSLLEFMDRYFGISSKSTPIYAGEEESFQFVDEDDDRAVLMSQYDELLAAFAESGAIIDELWNQLDDADERNGKLLALNVALVGVLFIVGMTYTLIHLV